MSDSTRMLVAVLLAAYVTAGQAAPKPKPMGWTGVLDEKSFQALHELKKGIVPALHGEDIELADGSRAYLSLPDSWPAEGDEEKPRPAVIVIHEWWGLNENIQHWSDRLAAAGYAALAVDLYEGKVCTTRDEALSSMQGVQEEKAQKTLQAARDFLREDARVQADRFGVIGWCFGGGWSLQTALQMPDLSVAVVYYGRLVDDVEQLKKINAHLLGIFGNQDPSIPPQAVDAFEKALDKARVRHQIHRYQANHAFANPSSARYEQKAAGDAWKEVQKFLKHHLAERH